MRSMVVTKNAIIIFCLVFSLMGCVIISSKNFNIRYDSNQHQGQELVEAIEDFFLENGFRISKKKHTMYPIDEKKIEFHVSDYNNDITNKMRSIDLTIVNDKEIYLEWIGGVEPPQDYSDNFRNSIEVYIEDRLNTSVSIIQIEEKN